MLDNLNNQSQASTPYLLTLFYVDPPVLPTNPFPNFVLSPPPLSLPCHQQSPLPLFFQLAYFFGWIGYHATFHVLFFVMIIWIYTALVP